MQNINEWKSYKSFALKGADGVEEHVERAGEESTFSRWAGHGKGLTTSSNTICKQQTYEHGISQLQNHIWFIFFVR